MKRTIRAAAARTTSLSQQSLMQPTISTKSLANMQPQRAHRAPQCTRHTLPAQFVTWLLVALVALLTLLPATVLANCPNRCDCDDRTLVVQCEEGALDVLPITLNPSVERLVIKHNKIRTIDSSVQFYTELRFLDLSYNNLVNIPPNTFGNQRKLQELHLDHNRIGTVNNRTFNGLSAVMVLNLRGNLLDALEDGTFRQLAKIEELNLGQNRISRIDGRAFDGLASLRVLYLDDNTLTTLPPVSSFRAMPNLAELFLGTNSYMSIPAMSFADLKGLTKLYLNGAGLHNLSTMAFAGLEELRYLDLSDNQLATVPTAELLHLERLEELKLGQNDFEVIPAGALAGQKNLRRLEIVGARSLMRVETGAFTTNTNLEYLNLSSNKMLSIIQPNALSGLPHLREVILKENRLSTLAEGLFPWSDLHTLDLSDNPIVCDCQVLWLRNLLVSKNASSDQLANVVCSAPPHLKEQSLNQVAPSALGCSHSVVNQQAMIGVLLVVIAASITALALIIYGCRRRIRELLKGGWGNSALSRKEQEYQKAGADDDYMTRQQHPCSLSIHPTASYPGGGSYNPHPDQYAGTRPIPVTEL